MAAGAAEPVARRPVRAALSATAEDLDIHVVLGESGLEVRGLEVRGV
ncbi:hypothetical protein ABZV31_24105 [Streptomyces sp. NPDC005202]